MWEIFHATLMSHFLLGVTSCTIHKSRCGFIMNTIVSACLCVFILLFVFNHSLDCARVDLHQQLHLLRGQIVIMFLRYAEKKYQKFYFETLSENLRQL